VYYKSLDTEQ